MTLLHCRWRFVKDHRVVTEQ